ncbi:hypothetical protein J3T78_02260 [Staphylococcus nepalensis]|nr:hypothetical protein [Staphylococcus nepalensis]MBO1233780.1 hypothetical protein [Staphylococcus nepalensis]MBO1236530.1 hypothetical protein [Staphylococcus nepalensis]
MYRVKERTFDKLVKLIDNSTGTSIPTMDKELNLMLLTEEVGQLLLLSIL